MKLKEFIKSDKPMGIHCDTEDRFFALLLYLAERDVRWNYKKTFPRNIAPFSDKLIWGHYLGDTAIFNPAFKDSGGITYGSIKSAANQGIPVIEFYELEIEEVKYD